LWGANWPSNLVVSLLPARKLWGANILRRGHQHQMGRIHKYQPAKGGEVKRVLRMIPEYTSLELVGENVNGE